MTDDRPDKIALASELDRPPAFPDKTALARELCMAESTVDDFVRRSILPPPIKLSSGCVRWDWEEVKVRIRARKGALGGDPYLAGNLRAEAEKGPHEQTTKGKKRN